MGKTWTNILKLRPKVNNKQVTRPKNSLTRTYSLNLMVDVPFLMQVASFTGEKKAVDKYDKCLHKAYKASVQEGLAAGLGSGVFMLVLFCSYALAVWFGAKMIINNGYSGGAVLNITMAVLLGSL